MEERTYIQNLLESSGKFDIQQHQGLNFKKTHMSFTGTPRKHPTDKTKVVLVAEPFGSRSVMYEFSLSSIAYIEEVETITDSAGKSAFVMRLWVRKGEIANKIEPFLV
ncbi:MAG: inorganic pyrophosphatase Ppa [Spirochaetes bacterium]|nr:MAG: inorganic pyrophosphatase Ppa [Spirochaetota bacterium]